MRECYIKINSVPVYQLLRSRHSVDFLRRNARYWNYFCVPHGRLLWETFIESIIFCFSGTFSGNGFHIMHGINEIIHHVVLSIVMDLFLLDSFNSRSVTKKTISNSIVIVG